MFSVILFVCSFIQIIRGYGEVSFGIDGDGLYYIQLSELELTGHGGSQNGWLLMNAKYVFNCSLNGKPKNVIISNVIPNNRYSIAMYSVLDHAIRVIGIHEIDIDPLSPLKNMTIDYDRTLTIDFVKDRFQTLSNPRMSTYYTTINVFEAQYMQNISYDMKMMGYQDTIPPNVETSIRSSSKIKLSDLNKQWQWTIQESKVNSSIKPVLQSASFYHERPSKYGYYCVYYKRENEEYGAVPDCPNVTSILSEHARMLESSGIDFIALDDTNLDDAPNSVNDDVMQLRPAQIIYKTWSDLRTNNGTLTPDIVTWNKANGIEWQSYLDLYAQYPDMVLTVRDPNDSNKTKKVFFVPENGGLNETVVNLIANDNGKNDVLVQGMWGGGGLNPSLILNGTWTFFYPCRTLENVKETVSMESLTDCNFLMTVNSALGSQISASMSWQNNYGSPPFAAPSKLNGRTFMLIIKDVLSMKPDNVLFPSFNEHTAISFATPPSFGGNNTWGVGLYADPDRSNMGFYVDTYGSERSRAFEPTDESGDYYYRLVQSCVRVARMEYMNANGLNNRYQIVSQNVSDSNRICNIDGELCCDELQSYVDVWSLSNKESNDYLLSNNKQEVQNAIDNLGYKEICAPLPYSDTTVFCMSNDDLNTLDAHRGPLILYENGNNPKNGSYAETQIKRHAIYRCLTANGKHFIAKASDCDGIADSKMEYLIGYAADAPSTAMPRVLFRCKDTVNDDNSDYYYYHVVGDQCNQAISSSIIGYVFS